MKKRNNKKNSQFRNDFQEPSEFRKKIDRKKQKIKETLYTGRYFKKEFKSQMRLFITFTLGFTIAFTWRQTVFDLSQSIVNFFFKFKNSVVSSLIASVFITFVSIFLIYLASQWLKEDSFEGY